MKFSDIVGKQEVKEKLKHLVHSRRISHALLFSCTEGSYGLPLALAFAAYIQCENPTDSDSCGTCSSCVKHSKFVHPDLHFSYPVVTLKRIKDRSTRSTDFLKQWRSALVKNPYLGLTDWYEEMGVENKQGFLSVEESADILRKMSLKSFESEYKIQIIWFPEKMRLDTANKLLKIIEEPPEHTLFFLITEQREQLLPTILSRTQLIKVPPLNINELSEFIAHKFNLDQRAARRVANLADLKLNVAIQIASNDKIENEVNHEEEFIHWMRLCYNPFHERNENYAWLDLINWIDKMAKAGREHLKHYFNFCLDASRGCLLVNEGADELNRFDDDVIPGFSKFSRFINQHNVDEVYKLFNKAHYEIERNANAKILLLDLSFKMNKLLNKKADL